MSEIAAYQPIPTLDDELALLPGSDALSYNLYSDRTTGWVGTSANFSGGEGGHSQGRANEGGAGGGGYGGVGGGCANAGASGGGGAGASYAAQATADNGSNVPAVGEGGAPTTESGAVVISFDVCSTYPTLAVCE